MLNDYIINAVRFCLDDLRIIFYLIIVIFNFLFINLLVLYLSKVRKMDASIIPYGNDK